MKNFITILTILILSIGCKKNETCPKLSLANSDISNTEEYLIVDAVMSNHHNNEEVFVVISQESSSGTGFEGIEEFLDLEQAQLDSSDMINFLMLNEETSIWGDKLFEKSYELVNKDELDCFFEETDNGWKKYFSRYENSAGFFRFTRPLIYKNNRAIIEYGQYCGGLCGYGFMVILKKEDGTWKVSQLTSTWIS